MKSIQEIQEEIIDDFKSIGDGFEQYAYLIELACLQPPLPEEQRAEEHLVAGCISNVWLHMYSEENRFFLRGDSNTLIIKGILYLLEKILNGQPLPAVAGSTLFFLEETSVMDTFETSRRKGMKAVLTEIKAFADKAMNGGNGD